MTAQISRAANDSLAPTDLEAWWLPFTANRSFKQRPRMIARAKGMYYYPPEGREVIDGAA
ncbi:MAG: omega amino acid--pyruvate aminotransferase, partial [Microvirga sp.]|nr:omega amino acid--pyruvate aminotransferase [Microvirga sp.]